MLATRPNIERALSFADLFLAAVAIRGERAPLLVTREMLKLMKPRSVVIDLSIDMGGCFETSRPTSFPNPVYEVDGILHFCVPNLPSVAARSATLAYTNALLPYLTQIVEKGIDGALGRIRRPPPRGLPLPGRVQPRAVGAGLRCPSSAAAVLGRLSGGSVRWLELYRQRVTTAEEAVKAIRSGDHVWIHSGCSNPEELISAMVARAGELEGVEVSHILTLGHADYVKPAVREIVPPSVAVHRRQRPRRGQRGPGRLRARPPAPDPPPDLRRNPAHRRGAHPHLAPRRARLLLVRGRGWLHQGSGGEGQDRDRSGQQAHAARPWGRLH